MRMLLTKKMFLAFASVVFLTVLAMSFAVNWSFQRGFNDYLRAQDQERLREISTVVRDVFVRDGDLQSIKRDEAAWHRLVNPRLPPTPILARHHLTGGSGRGSESREIIEVERVPPPPPRSDAPLPFQFRLVLHDAGGEYIAGNRRIQTLSKESATPYLSQDVSVDEEVVGRLILQPSTPVDSTLAQVFLKRQITQLLWFGPIAILFALIAAAFLMRYFLRPIAALAGGTKTLTKGDYQHRIAVSSEDELGQLASDFNRLAQTLETEEQMRHRLVADTSHELRTPLAVLRSEIEAIQDGIRKPEPYRIAALHTQVMSLSQLVDDLHQLSLGDANLDLCTEEKVDIHAMLLELTTVSEALAGSHGLTLRYVYEGEELFVNVDPTKLVQLFNNLLDNSTRHTASGGEVLVRLEDSGNQVTVSISDSAPGVPDEALPRLFDRLYRVDRSRNRGSGGSGLGLAIVEQISSKMGGSLRADHSPLGGLLVELKLPKYKNHG